jgi:Secretion system C-terminal sorting domain
MRTILLFTLALLVFPIASNSQSPLIERTIDFARTTEVHDMKKSPTGQWFMAGNCWYQNTLDLEYAIRTNSLFEMERVSNLTTVNSQHLGLTLTSDTNVIVGSWDNVWCDVGWFSSAYKLNQNLDTIWTRGLLTSGHPMDIGDSSIIFFRDNGMSRVFTDGTIDQDHDLAYESIGSGSIFADAVVTGYKEFIVAGETGIIKYSADTLFTFPTEIQSWSSFHTNRDWQQLESGPNGGFFAISDFELFRFDSDFVGLDTLDLLTTIFEFFDPAACILQSSSDAVYLLGIANSEPSMIAKLDHNFNVQWIDTLPYGAYNPVNLFWDTSGQLIFLASEGHFGSSNAVVFEIDPMTGAMPSFSSDVAVTSAWLFDSVLTPNLKQVHFKCVVENRGSDTIHSFFLNFNSPGGWMCYGDYYYEEFDSLTLLPGASDTFDLGMKTIAWYSGLNLNFNFCVFATSPNHHYDRNILDNYSCVAINYVNVNPAIASLPVVVYPNPSNGIIQISIPNELKNEEWEITIFNAEGKRLLSQEINRDEPISLVGINAGLLFYQLSLNGIPARSGKIILNE